MISKDEIKSIAAELKLKDVTVEKDYVLGWLLAGIGNFPAIRNAWVFKGGTCLRKCYFDNYRFSEDLDFTIAYSEAAELQFIEKAVADIVTWVQQNSGIEINLSRTVFERFENSASQVIIQGRIYYKGPISPNSIPQWPRIKFDLTPNDAIVSEPVLRDIKNNTYSDYNQLSSIQIKSYNLVDLFAEKIRALFERTRPRDVYDVVEIYNREMENIPLEALRKALKEKCIFKDIYELDINKLHIDQCATGWQDQLSHQLTDLPSFERYFEAFEVIYDKMELGKLLGSNK